MARPTLLDLNPVELNYDPYMIIIDNCSGSCHTLDDSSANICVLNETEDVNKCRSI